jgi:uncharacterized protein
MRRTPFLEKSMSGNISWFEIPSRDFERAVQFYEAVFQLTMRREDIGGRMAVFPSAENAASGAIVAPQPGYEPSNCGPTIYLSAGADLQPLLLRAHAHGGKVLVEKTALPPGMGFFAHLQDSEGNRVGLHSLA